MKKIFLLGDSIRCGYDAYVRESMENVAEVFYPSENCRFASYILRNVHFWKDDLHIDRADAVHWNAGLWDTLRIYGDEPFSKPDVYADYVERVTRRLIFLFPGAKIIFATSTPVIEEGFITEFEYRTNRDIEEYNRIACEICAHYGCLVNDLYGLLKDAPRSLHSDQTHFYTAEGTALIGGRVNHVLCDALGILEDRLRRPNPENFVVKGVMGDQKMYIKRGSYYERVLGI